MNDLISPILERMADDVSVLDPKDPIVKQLASDIKQIQGFIEFNKRIQDEVSRALSDEFQSRFKR